VHITSSLPYRSSHSERQARLPDRWHSTVRCTWHRNHAKQNVFIGVLTPLPEGEQPRLLACRSVKVGEDAWTENRKEGSRWLFFQARRDPQPRQVMSGHPRVLPTGAPGALPKKSPKKNGVHWEVDNHSPLVRLHGLRSCDEVVRDNVNDACPMEEIMLRREEAKAMPERAVVRSWKEAVRSWKEALDRSGMKKDEMRNRAAARWKEMMEKDFDLYYTPGRNSPSPEMRTATAEEYAAYQLGQINRKLDKIIAALGSTT
jgi:hypothetical protein